MVCPNKAAVSIELDRSQHGILTDVQCRGENIERLALIRTFRYFVSCGLVTSTLHKLRMIWRERMRIFEQGM